MAGRVTYSYYLQIGVLECVVESLLSYVDIAVRLGTDKIWRESISSEILNHQHLLFERDEVVNELSDFFHTQLS